MGVTRKALRFIGGLVVPHSIAVLAARAVARRRTKARRERLREATTGHGSGDDSSFGYQEAVRFLVHRGADREQVLAGSMSEASLHYCGTLLMGHLDAGPALGLHIGNFVGVSLAYFTDLLARHDPASRIVSIDPNVPHRGIHQPLDSVLALLERYGLQRNNLILTGYTLEKNLSNDGYSFAGYDPLEHYEQEVSGEHQLEGLALWSREAFHFCVIDGNHDAAYLRRELAWITRLLKPGALLMLDDVADSWPDIRRVHAETDRARYADVGTDGRVAVMKKIAEAHE